MSENEAKLNKFIEDNKAVIDKGAELELFFDERTYVSSGRACFINYIPTGYREISWHYVANKVGEDFVQDEDDDSEYEYLMGF